MLPYLLELRRRVLLLVLFFFVCFLLCFYFSQTLFAQLLYPLMAGLKAQHASLISTRLFAPLLTPLELAFEGALFCTIPLVLLQAWRFVSPGLYRQERRLFAGVLFGSLALFVAGVLFCFYLVLPNLFYLLLQARPAGVLLRPDMTESVQVMLHFLWLFGLCFQLPLVCLVLVYSQVVSVTSLRTIRPYVMVAAFIIGMLLTPPDVCSQIMLALPLCALYELGIFLCGLLV